MTILGFRSLDVSPLALIVWLLSSSNILLGFTTFKTWVLSIVGVAIWMVIGGALSYIFVRGTTTSLDKVESTARE